MLATTHANLSIKLYGCSILRRERQTQLKTQLFWYGMRAVILGETLTRTALWPAVVSNGPAKDEIMPIWERL